MGLSRFLCSWSASSCDALQYVGVMLLAKLVADGGRELEELEELEVLEVLEVMVLDVAI